MPTITFDTHATDGIIQIPETFKEWYSKTLKVRLLSEETAIPVTSASWSVPQAVDYSEIYLNLYYFLWSAIRIIAQHSAARRNNSYCAPEERYNFI